MQRKDLISTGRPISSSFRVASSDKEKKKRGRGEQVTTWLASMVSRNKLCSNRKAQKAGESKGTKIPQCTSCTSTQSNVSAVWHALVPGNSATACLASSVLVDNCPYDISQNNVHVPQHQVPRPKSEL
ncbi:hypothetical protein EAG_14660 [Camponotus floridanus]|uniref:Uncharacterized protein n=1 Tax=Camponotus floridanus TaxID=104421 RepID=E2ACT6_CAMFO|nr:hypothetical protein EAG_14660 [Camponotus floridanus]